MLGHALAFARDRTALMQRGFAEFGPVFSILLGTRRCAVFAGREFYNLLFGLGGSGLARRGERRWSAAGVATQEPGSAPGFTSADIDHPLWQHDPTRCLGVIHGVVQDWLDALGDHGDLDLGAEIETVVQNATGYAFFGHDFEETIGPEFWMISAEMGKSVDVLFAPRWSPPSIRHHERALDHIASLLERPLADRRNHPGQHQDCLQILVDTADVADHEVAELALARVFALHDATVGLATWTVIQLLQHPVILGQVRDEILSAHPEPGRPLAPEDLARLPKLRHSIRESARLHPTPDTVLRSVPETTEFGGFALPAGWLVMAIADASQLDPGPWSDASSYNPNRFAPASPATATSSSTLAAPTFPDALVATLVTLFLQEFELELHTPDPTTVPGIGNLHVQPTRVRYRRLSSGRRINVPTQGAASSGSPGLPG